MYTKYIVLSHMPGLERKISARSVSFTQNQIGSGITLIGDWKMQGGFFWNRIRTLDIRETEEKAFDKILAFAYVEKYQKSKAYDDVRRVQIFRQLTGDNVPKFSRYLLKVKDKSVSDNVYFHNSLNDKEVVYRTRSLKTSHFDLIQSENIRLRQPIDFTRFLELKPLNKDDLLTMLTRSTVDESKSMMHDNLLTEIIDRTPFFIDVSDFKASVEHINVLSYIKRAYVFYVFAEYYNQVFYRAASLYNVEMMTYYATLFAGFEIKIDSALTDSAKRKLDAKVKRLTKIRDSLKKGDTSKDLVNALAAEPASRQMNYVDKATGLPFDSPVLYHGSAWPFRKKNAPPDFSKLKLRSVAQMAELMLNEPLIEERDPIDSKKTIKQAYLIRAYEPILSTDLSDVAADSMDKSLIFIEDIKAKMLIAMREVRKNMLLDAFHQQTNPEFGGYTQSMDRLQKEFDIRAAHQDESRRHLSIEHSFDDIFEHIFKPTCAKLDDSVNANIAAASRNIQTMKVSKTSSYLGASDLFLSATDLSPWGASSREASSSSLLSSSSRLSGIGRKIPI